MKYGIYLDMFMKLLKYPERYDFKEPYGALTTVDPKFIYRHLPEMRIIIVPAPDSYVDVPYCDKEETLDLPFKCCWFESAYPVSRNPEEFKDHWPPSLLDYFGHEKNKDYRTQSTPKFSVMGLYVYEKAPKDYNIIILAAPVIETNYNTKIHSTGEPILIGVDYRKDNDLTQTVTDTVNLILNSLKRNSFQHLTDNKIISYKYKKLKQNVKIKDTIIINNKPTPKSINPSHIEDFEYSHRFEVMGHWRTLPNPQSVGKDRDGEPVKGYTWIAPYIKGPENKPLIKKTRIIAGDD